MFLNTSNTDVDASLAAQVKTGAELSIDLDELGWDGSSSIKAAGFIDGDNELTSSTSCAS